MRRLTPRLIMLAFLLCSFLGVRADHLTARFPFAARMNGAQEVPAVSTNAIGVATFNLNAKGDTLCMTMTTNGLTGPITGVHIHEGVTGTSGGVVVNLMPFLSGNSLQGSISGSSLAALDRYKLFSGGYYINVHTAANPNGEIRGQILLEQDKGFSVRLSGQEQVPQTPTFAKGLGFFMLSQHNRKLSFYIVMDSLNSAVTGAELNLAPAGSNGIQVADLSSFVNGNVISGSIDPTAFLSALLNDSIYVNVQTMVDPSGSIRGQLRVEPYLFFDARMNGAQEVPAVTTNGVGLGIYRVSYSLDSIWYEVQVTGMSSPVTGYDISSGSAGNTGSIVFPLSSSINNANSISGMTLLSAGPKSDTVRTSLLEGGLYMNVHTAFHLTGEIRGQLYRTMREGYSFSVTGDQEVPAVQTTAYGSGMVSVDRDQTNAHFMIAATNINATSAHFHQAPAGISGPVIFDLGSYLNNGGIYGYWLDTGSNAFSPAFSNKFRKDSVYVNLHTTAHPSGEIRGQVMRRLCTALPAGTLGINAIGGGVATLAVFPNPANDIAQVEVQLIKPLSALLRLSDPAGHVLWTIELAMGKGKQVITVPLSNLPPGLYYLNLISEEGQLSRKLVKQ